VQSQDQNTKYYGGDDQYVVDQPFYTKRNPDKDGRNNKTRITDYLIELVGVEEGEKEEKYVSQNQNGKKLIEKDIIYVSKAIHTLGM
jgi:hypothetical protein